MEIDVQGEVTFIAKTLKDKKKLLEIQKLFKLAEKPIYTSLKFIEYSLPSTNEYLLTIRGIESD